MEQPKHIDMQTPNGAQLNLDALYQIAPSCFTEANGEDGEVHRVVDFNKLRLLLGDKAVEDAPEVYDFTWVGKRAALQEAAAPINKTLRPCPEESVDWEHTQNLYIEGDNLEVLKLLQNSYMGKVKMIYIDPPYNTGNDFVYHDDFTIANEDYEAFSQDEEGNKFFKNTESSTKGRFHSAWCSMIYARLIVARSLLAEDGVLFSSIDDNEVENLKKIAEEVFGYNHCEIYIWDVREPGTMPKTAKNTVRKEHEYIVACFKSADMKLYKYFSQKYLGNNWPNPDNDPRGGWMSANISRGSEGSTGGTKSFVITNPKGISFDRDWSITKEEYDELLKDNRIYFADDGYGVPRKKIFTTDIIESIQSSLFEGLKSSQSASSGIKNLLGAKCFDFPKPVPLIQRMLQIASQKESIILDFFSGSATTAHAVMQLNAEDGGNRKFIMVQLPEETEEKSEAYKAGYKNICEIGKERIRRAGKMIKEESPLTTKDLDTGFRVFKCESSNYKDVAFAPKDYTQEMLAGLLDNIKEDRTDLDLLFDCMLRWGVELSLPLSSQKVDGCTIHNVNDGDLVACFDGNVTEKVIDAIAALSPVRVVFRDSSFNEAANKMNLFELFKQKCDWTDEEVKNNVRVI